MTQDASTAQAERARQFAALHIAGNPLVLYNAWDAGSARAIAKAGAAAIATGSWGVAAAQGFKDGQALPFDRLMWVVERIVASVDLPVSVDIEGGYAEDASPAMHAVLEAGAIGVNFEDQVMGTADLYPTDEQADRIAKLRAGADAAGVPAFINARTDLFLKETDPTQHGNLIDAALARAEAYAAAGASGFFVPGLTDTALLGTLCGQVALPVNSMRVTDQPGIQDYAEAGVARVSHGAAPYLAMMGSLRSMASDARI